MARSELNAWQARLLSQIIEAGPGPWRLSLHTGRANGKAQADRYALAGALLFGHHVHVAARDGLWCVSLTEIGPLWQRLTRTSG